MANPVMKWQILSKEPEACAAFYGAVFGWTIDSSNALGYREVTTGSDKGVDGGIWPSPPEGQAFVQLFVEVESVDETVAKVAEHGGKTIIPPQQLPDGTRMAILLDAEGIPFGLMGK